MTFGRWRLNRGRLIYLTFYAETVAWRVKRTFHVTLVTYDEGVSASCPELPGCQSRGANTEEALEHIEDAIRGYIDLYGQPKIRCEIREMEVVTAA